MTAVDLLTAGASIAGIVLATRWDDKELRQRGVSRRTRLVAATLCVVAIGGVVVLPFAFAFGVLAVLLWLTWAVFGVRLIERTWLTSKSWRLAGRLLELERQKSLVLELDRAARARYRTLEVMAEVHGGGHEVDPRFRQTRAEYMRLGFEETEARAQLLKVLAEAEKLRDPSTDSLITLLQETYGRFALLDEPAPDHGEHLNEELATAVARFWAVRKAEMS